MSVKVSIYIPTKNRATQVTRAIDSCLLQTEKNIEIIVVDDGSIDSTPDILKKYQEADSRVRPIILSSSVGACEARNIAINIATADLVTGLDDDDLFLPFRITDFLEQQKSINSLLGTTRIIGYQGYKIPSEFPGCEVDYQSMLEKNHIGNQAFFEKKKALKIGGFDTNLSSYQDYDFWIRMIDKWGPSRMLNNYSMLVEQSSSISITKSEAAWDGFDLFMQKHDMRFSNNQRKKQWANAFANFGYMRNHRDFLKMGLNRYALFKFLTMVIKRQAPSLYTHISNRSL